MLKAEEIDIAFALLRSAISGEAPALDNKPIETDVWWNVFKLVQQHHVVALCYDAAALSGVPRKVIMPWLAEREKAVEWHHYQSGVQQDIVNVMQRNDIPIRVLKGTHLAQYYHQPELREFVDLDFYFGDRHTEADELARKELHISIDTKPHHHTKFNYRGVTVESHYDFFNRHYPASNRKYNCILASLGTSTTFDVLHFLRHAAIHFASQGLKMRDLCDWAFIVARASDVDWNMVKATMKSFGMSDFVATLDSVTHSRLGVASPLWDNCPTGFDKKLEKDMFQDSHAGGKRDSGWKRSLAFNDSSISLLIHKVISHLSH